MRVYLCVCVRACVRVCVCVGLPRGRSTRGARGARGGRGGRGGRTRGGEVDDDVEAGSAQALWKSRIAVLLCYKYNYMIKYFKI